MPVAEPYSLDRGCEKESTLPKRVIRVTAETGDTKTDHNRSTSQGLRQFSQLLIVHIRSFNCYTYGNEGCGLPREDLAKLQVQPFTIAGTGAIESLNVAAAVNFCQYELNRPS